MYLVFDIGGTKIRLASSEDGKTLKETEIISTPADFDEAIKVIKSTTNAICSNEKVEAVAGGIAGLLDFKKATLLRAPHLTEWIQKPLKEALQEVFGAPVFLEHDAAIAGLGEATIGAGVGKDIVVYMTISTGVGGVKIVKGQIDPHVYNFEIGHQIISLDGPLCPGCDGQGHLESYVSGTALERLYKKSPEEIDDPKVWDEVARYLAVGLHNTILHYSPDIIVLGGSVTNSIPLDKVSFHLAEISSIYPTMPEIAIAKLGDENGLYGSLHYLRTKVN